MSTLLDEVFSTINKINIDKDYESRLVENINSDNFYNDSNEDSGISVESEIEQILVRNICEYFQQKELNRDLIEDYELI